MTKLYVYNGGFLTQGRVRRILELSGYDISIGLPGPDDHVGVWGKSPTSPRGEKVARSRNAPVLRVEDAFLRSVLPGRDGAPPLGLHLDSSGVHFDPSTRSDLEKLLTEDPLDDAAVLTRARDGMARLKRAHLSKYTCFDPATPAPAPGYVLLIDQTKGDASLTASTADRNTFLEMLFLAREEHPKARILIKTHPETIAGHREGHFRGTDLSDGGSFLTDPVSPWTLMEGAIAVYTVSSQFGFEAIMMGHNPVVMGQPFYMGWGLTDDRKPLDRRQRKLTRAQLFAAAMILYPTWYDPYRDRLCSFEDAVATLEAETRAWRDDHAGWQAKGISLWKRRHMQQFFGQYGKLKFINDKGVRPRVDTAKTMAWASKTQPNAELNRIEDGFLRSKGLGADLVPPLSLILDDTGIYYDPTRESRLERLINATDTLPEADLQRAEKLLNKLIKDGLSKYNLDAAALPDNLPQGRRILVPGQVEDDASIRLGTTDICTNTALLQATRAANPAAIVMFKPHPDVEAGLRPGAVENPLEYADIVLTGTAPIAAINAADAVWTMTSTLGFEAVLRGKPVTCVGQPFYAGWGLTDDRAEPLLRRHAQPSLAAFAHACLIDYPRYHDPVTNRPCPPEVAAERLSSGMLPHPGRTIRLISKLQGLYASYAHLWRKT